MLAGRHEGRLGLHVGGQPLRGGDLLKVGLAFRTRVFGVARRGQGGQCEARLGGGGLSEGGSGAGDGVLRLHVTAEVHFALEGPVTDGTGEGLEARVLATVSYQIGRLAECLATLTTNVRLLTCKNTHTEQNTQH